MKVNAMNNLSLKKVGKALSRHTAKNRLLPRLQEDDQIWMIKTKDGYKPAVRFMVA
jgi:hypothetical protein